MNVIDQASPATSAPSTWTSPSGEVLELLAGGKVASRPPGMAEIQEARILAEMEMILADLREDPGCFMWDHAVVVPGGRRPYEAYWCGDSGAPDAIVGQAFLRLVAAGEVLELLEELGPRVHGRTGLPVLPLTRVRIVLP
jgi:hypothetical protein